MHGAIRVECHHSNSGRPKEAKQSSCDGNRFAIQQVERATAPISSKVSKERKMVEEKIGSQDWESRDRVEEEEEEEEEELSLSLSPLGEVEGLTKKSVEESERPDFA